MSDLKVCFQKFFNALNLGIAYVMALGVLIIAVVRSRFHRGFYDVKFKKVRCKWYCHVPGFPKALFEHTMLVCGAAKTLEYYSQGDDLVHVSFRLPENSDEDYFCGFRLKQESATLTGGAYYKDAGGFFTEEFWLCPVTLFLLGWYPKQIFIYKVHKNYTYCPLFWE